MNSEVVLDAIGKHLDALASTVNWIIVFAAVVSWAGIRKESSIEVFGVKVERRLAFLVSSTIYLIANVMVLILFLRIGDLLLLVEPSKVTNAVARLATHPWLLNPYSYFGGGWLASFHSCEGYGLLIATWWLCNTSMSTLVEDKGSKVGKIMLGIFLGLGLLTMQAIQRGYGIVLLRLSTTDASLFQGIQGTVAERNLGDFLGIAVGGLFFLAGNLLQQRWLREATTPTSPK
jgi:hypothetical protein